MKKQFAIINEVTGDYITKSSYDHTISWTSPNYGYVALFDNPSNAKTQLTRFINKQKKFHGHDLPYRVVEVDIVQKDG